MPAKKKTLFRPSTAPASDPYPIVTECFGPPYIPYSGPNGPSCFNGIIAVEKFRLTVERIAEPKEVIGARLQKLWEESDNHHHHAPLMAYARRLGVVLAGAHGAKAPVK